MVMTKIGRKNLPIDVKAPIAIPKENDPKLVAFRVPMKLNKIQIRNYLEELYKVEIEKVHTLIYLGKQKMDPQTGRRYKLPDYKKAYVRLVQPFEYPSLEEQRRLSGKGEE